MSIDGDAVVWNGDVYKRQQLRRLEAVLFALLGQQVLLCDLQLFLVRIA